VIFKIRAILERYGNLSFDILALLPHWPSTSYFASTIQTQNFPQSNPILYTFGLAPMYKLNSSHIEPALRPVHRGGLLVWSASTIEPGTLHLLCHILKLHDLCHPKQLAISLCNETILKYIISILYFKCFRTYD
jgi:hypothetical protein